MIPFELFLLGLALAMDAAAAALIFGIIQLELNLSARLSRANLVAGVFGFFQMMLLVLGSKLGFYFTFSQFGHYFHLVSAMVFLALSLKCFQDSLKSQDNRLNWGFFPLVSVAVLTSVDAFFSGLSFATHPSPWEAGFIVGVITFFICFSFYFLSQFINNIPHRLTLRIAAMIFGFLGLQLMWSLRDILLRG